MEVLDTAQPDVCGLYEVMDDQKDAVVILLNRLRESGREWYRNASDGDVGLFERWISGNFTIFEGHEIHTIRNKPEGSFPKNRVLLLTPSPREKESILGLWLRWNFNNDPFDFRLFVGHWSEIDNKKSFIAFRFEAPEEGEVHDYYHCQPCRNFGDKETVPNAALVSEHFPATPLKASNILELTVCALLAVMGRSGLRHFFKQMFKKSPTSQTKELREAYNLYCK